MGDIYNSSIFNKIYEFSKNITFSIDINYSFII